jgi:hypothetical protein
MKLKNIFATTLIPFNTLLLFFLILNNRLVVPAWLQVLGRMHPVILHFPIVLVLIYAAAVLFTPKTIKSELWYIKTTEWVLLVAAFAAAITALMACFYREKVVTMRTVLLRINIPGRSLHLCWLLFISAVTC